MPRLLQSSGGDFFLHHVRENAPRFKLGQLSQDAWLGSRGEGYRAVNETAGNDGRELNGVLGWFLLHTPELNGVGSVAKISDFEEGITPFSGTRLITPSLRFGEAAVPVPG
jgi:hypothetical protein